MTSRLVYWKVSTRGILEAPRLVAVCLGVVFLLSFGSADLSAQPFASSNNRSAVHWYFGRNAGLSFLNGSPTVLTNGSLNTLDGSAVFSHPETGALLFYTNGITVWDSTHAVMPNGVDLMGHESSGQPALIVPAPDDSSLFYIFTTGAANTPNTSTRYSVVDMRLNGGRGDVTVKNELLVEKGTEKITATRHCNGRDYWVIAHAWGSNRFHVYPITPDGVGAPVLSDIGISYPASGDIQGTFQMSSNGKILAVSSSRLATLELFDFNNADGTITNHRVVASADRNYYGLEFSPDNTRLYVNTLPLGSNPAHLYQLNLAAGDLAAIQASRYELQEVAGSWGGGQLQLGPDGKIYISWFNREWLGVIDNPDGLGAACAYLHDGLHLQGMKTNYGLPNIIDSDLPDVATGFFSLQVRLELDKGEVEQGETFFCRVILCNGSNSEARRVKLLLSLPAQLQDVAPPAGGVYVVDSLPAFGCDTLVLRMRAQGEEGPLLLCAVPNDVEPSARCLLPEEVCGSLTLRPAVDTAAVDYNYYLPAGCSGTQATVDVLFNSRRYTDTIIDVRFDGPDAEYFAFNGPVPIRFVIYPTRDQWIPVIIRRAYPGPLSAVMSLITARGDTTRVRLISAVNSAVTPLLDITEVLVRRRSGDFDTCVTVTNSMGRGVRLLDTVWLRGNGGGQVRLTDPALPVYLGAGASVRLCFTVSSPTVLLNDTLIIGGQEAVNFCPHCAYQVIAFRGIEANPPLSGVESEEQSNAGLNVSPNPVKDEGVIRFTLDKSARLRIAIVDELGRSVATVAEMRFTPGMHTLPFSVRDLPSGSYFVVMQEENRFIESMRITH